MDRLETYIIKNLSIIFLSIFSALFTIASVIFLIKLATYTAVIQLNLLEMAKLYMFVIPELLFFTLPITFFVASALTIYRLSNENEIIVIFALGIHPKFIIKTLLKPAILLSTILLFNFIVIFPHAKLLSKNFISYKTSEAKFNLSASEFGHKFGDWLLYLGKENSDGSFSNIFLFNKQEKEETLIEAKKALIVNKDGILKLKLIDGEGYSYSKEKLSQINFNVMHINNNFENELVPYANTIDYWFPEHKENETAFENILMKDDIEKKRKKMTINTVLSFLPILCLFFITSISIINLRHQKTQIYLFLFIGVAVYYGLTLGLVSKIGLYTIPIVMISWLTVTYTLYKKIILERF